MNRLILAVAALAVLTVGAHAATIRFGTEGGYQPYNYVGDDGKLAGYDIDVGNELCKRAQLECSFVTNDWDSIIPNLLAGNYDAIIDDMTVTPERQQQITFTDYYFPPDPSRFLSKTGKTFDYTALKGLKIGAQTGTIQADYIDQHFKADNTILKYDTQDQELADLNNGNLDLVFIDGSVAWPTADGSKGALKTDGPDILIGNGAGIGLRKTDTDLIAKLNTALAAMKADGSIDTLIAKYFPHQPKPYWTAN